MVRTVMDGKRVRLRRPQKKEVSEIHKMIGDPEVSRFTLFPSRFGHDDAAEFLKIARKAWRTETGYVFGIEDIASGELIGIISAYNVSRRHRKAEVGYLLGKQFRGLGLMSEAVGLMLSFCFNELRLKRVYALVFPDNGASASVLKRSGFSYEATMRKSRVHRGKYRDYQMYSILREEWR